MAKIWPVYEGDPSTVGDPWAEIPLDEAVRVLDLDPGNFLMDLLKTPKFGDTERDLTWVGYRHIVVEVGRDEINDEWRSGFYKSPLQPHEAYFRIRVHQQLGEFWRDEWKKGPDAEGEAAMWLWAVLKADAPDSEWAWDNRERIQTDVRKVASESGVSEWVFVRFRKEKEERIAS